MTMTSVKVPRPQRRGASGPSIKGQGFFARHARLIVGVGFSAVVILVWEFLTATGVLTQVQLPRPTAVVQEFWSGLNEGWLWPHLRATARVWAAGFVLSVIAGIALGIVAGLSQILTQVIGPWLNALYVMPDVAFVPVFILWFGIGFQFKVWYVFLAGFFFVAVNTHGGVRATEGNYVRMAQSFQASRWTLIRTVILPGSVPHILTGVRQAAGRTLVGVVAAEFVASNVGVGFMTSVSGQTFYTARVVTGVVILATAGIAVSELLRLIEKRFDRWRQ